MAGQRKWGGYEHRMEDTSQKTGQEGQVQGAAGCWPLSKAAGDAGQCRLLHLVSAPGKNGHARGMDQQLQG